MLKHPERLETWLSGLEQWLLLHRVRVQFPTPTQQLTTSVTIVPRNFRTSSGLHRVQDSHMCTYIHVTKQAYIFLKYLKKYSNEHILNTNDHRVPKQAELGECVVDEGNLNG